MSPIPTLVGATPPQWDRVAWWPTPRPDDDLITGIVGNDARYTDTAQQHYDTTQVGEIVPAVWATGTGTTEYAAGINAGAALTAGYPVARLAVTAVAPDRGGIMLGGMGTSTPTAVANTLRAGCCFASPNRVFWLAAHIRWRDLGAAAPGNATGFLLQPTDAQVTPSWPTELVGAGNRGGMGLVGDGAGNWIYRSFDRTGVATIRESIALPAHVIGAWNRAEWIIVGTRPGLIPAYFEFWFNGTLICTRNWAGALLEPIGGVAGVNANEWRWTPYIQNTGGNSHLYVAQVVARWGRYLRDGTEIQGF